VDEVRVVAVRDAIDDGMVALDGEFVPAHVRDVHLVAGEALDATRKEVQPVDGPALGGPLRTLGEHELEADTDAQNRRVRRGLDEHVVEREFRTHSPNAPTPGSTRASAFAMVSGSSDIVTVASARSSPRRRLRRFPTP
jgi:hypothetical protein